VQQLAADAARSSVAGLDDTERAELSKDFVTANAEKYPLLRAAAIAVDARPSTTDARDFVVSINYDARDLPIWRFSELVPLPSKEISRVSVIRRGGDK
jgi:Flp pilus assembly protein TadG